MSGLTIVSKDSVIPPLARHHAAQFFHLHPPGTRPASAIATNPSGQKRMAGDFACYGPDPSPMLIVDDNSEDRFILRMRLGAARIANPVLLCADGEAAVEQLNRIEQTSGIVPAAVFLDIRMPRRGGFAVLEWIRGHGRFARVPVMFVTGSLHERDRDRAFALGANAYLQKFPLPGELIAALERCSAHQRTQATGGSSPMRSIRH